LPEIQTLFSLLLGLMHKTVDYNLTFSTLLCTTTAAKMLDITDRLLVQYCILLIPTI